MTDDTQDIVGRKVMGIEPPGQIGLVQDGLGMWALFSWENGDDPNTAVRYHRADLIEAQAAEIEKLRGLLSDALDAIDYAGDELALWLEAAVALEVAGFEMGETEHAVSFAIGAAKKIRAALNKKSPGYEAEAS